MFLREAFVFEYIVCTIGAEYTTIGWLQPDSPLWEETSFNPAPFGPDRGQCGAPQKSRFRPRFFDFLEPVRTCQVPGAVQGASGTLWDALARFGALLGRSWDALRRSWDAPGTLLGRYDPLLGRSGTLLRRSRAFLGHSWDAPGTQARTKPADFFGDSNGGVRPAA